ncbi:GNAT family N-acetyltransferase [Lacticaseibacillus sp. GG6-2]
MTHPQATNRITFSQWRATDRYWANLLWGDPQVTRYISRNGFDQAAITNRLALEVTSQEADGVQYWPLLTEDGNLIGCCGLQARSDAGVYELGYHLRPQYWGQGLASEAADAVVTFARTTLHASALVARHHPENAASRHIIVDKLGFAFTHNEVYSPTGLVTPTYRLSLRHPQATTRLRFGVWQAGQAALAELLWGDPQVTALLTANGFTQAQIQERLTAEVASLAEDGVQYWPLYAQDGALVGCCGLHARAQGEYELGYHLRPQYWQQGLATEAATAVVAFAKQVCHAPGLIAGHNPANQASKHVLAKLGFRYTHDVFYAPTGKNSPMYHLDLMN